MSNESNDGTVTIYPPPRGTRGLPFVVVSIVGGRRSAEFAETLEDASKLEREGRAAISRATVKADS